MDRIKSAMFIFSFFCTPYFVCAQKDSSDLKKDKIFYFIDADCDNCSVAGNKDSKIWVVTNSTYSGNMDDHEALLKKFKNILVDKYKADSVLVKRVVFRFQDSEEQLEESYAAKETKMKGKGYTLIKIEF